MGWLHDRKIVESITDPSSQELSMSRIGMGVMVGMMVLIDLVSIYLMLAGRFQKEWFGPLAVMNSSTVASLGLVYYGNSKAGAGGLENWKDKLFGTPGNPGAIAAKGE
jgi:hypothetical protein